MPDRLFADPRLAAIYDHFEGDRSDLAVYRALIEELDADTILDIGCGTGSLASLLAGAGRLVIAVDPAAASLAVAAAKPHADRVQWIHGDVTGLPPLQVDLAIMTGNVAQVFVTDEDWDETLAGAARAVRPGGHLVFETRDPDRRAWEGWSAEATHRDEEVPGVGRVTTWLAVEEVALPLVRFRATYRFERDGATIDSVSTLRFRSRDEIEDTVSRAGFDVVEVRDAPDRPGREWVYLTRRR